MAKTQESKLKFLQSDNTSTNEKKKTTSITVDINKGQTVSGRTQGATAHQPVTEVVGSMRRKEVNGSLDKGGDGAKTSGAGGKVSSKQEADEINKKKASAAEFLSKKLAEENNNNNSKPQWTTVALKKTDR